MGRGLSLFSWSIKSLFEQLNRAKEIHKHEFPDGNALGILKKALSKDLYTNDPMEKAKRARPSRGRKNLGRKVLRRTEYKKREEAGHQCEQTSPEGVRCAEKGGLELDHQIPYGMGGRSDDESTIALLCFAHNRWKGRIDFGKITKASSQLGDGPFMGGGFYLGPPEAIMPSVASPFLLLDRQLLRERTSKPSIFYTPAPHLAVIMKIHPVFEPRIHPRIGPLIALFYREGVVMNLFELSKFAVLISLGISLCQPTVAMACSFCTATSAAPRRLNPLRKPFQVLRPRIL